MGLYRTVLHEGLCDDLPRYLNRDLLLQLWPVLRTLVGRSVRAVWAGSADNGWWMVMRRARVWSSPATVQLTVRSP
jgi:hypothetical protein